MNEQMATHMRTYSSAEHRTNQKEQTMKLTPGTYRLADGTLARLSLTPTGYQVTTADGTTFITDTGVK